MWLFNESKGKEHLVKSGVPIEVVDKLDLLGFSSISNLLSSVKAAKHFELGENDIIVTMLTDSMELYQSRLEEMHESMGEYTEKNAAADDARWLKGVATDHLKDLTYMGRKRIHNLKYYTWVEQQGKTYEEIQAQWNDKDYWEELQMQVPEIDARIVEFNERVGLL